PPFRGAGGVETAGIVGASLERVIASLAIGAADRMDRREIDDIEAETGDVRQPRNAIVERAMSSRDAPLAARHHLVPRADRRPRAVGLEGGGPGSAPLLFVSHSPR